MKGPQYSENLTGSLRTKGQSRRRLIEALPDLEKEHEYRKMAAIMPILLRLQDERYFNMDKYGPGFRVDDVYNMLAHGYEVLRASPEQCSGDALKKYLRKTLTFVHSNALREGIQLELATSISEKEALDEADDFAVAASSLSRDLHAPGPADPATLAFGGHLAFRLWKQELKRIVERDKDANEEGADAVDDREWDGLSFEHDDSTWGLASGAKMLELWRLSEQRFQASWKVAAAPDVAWKLAELYCKAGKTRQLLELAKDGASRVKTDADIQALFILVARACALGSEMRQEVARAQLHLLQADPFCCSAIAGLLGTRASLGHEEMLDALLSHLDVCPKTDCFGWQGLADEIEQAQHDAQASISQGDAKARDLWLSVQHHRPFCQPQASSPLLTRLLEQRQTPSQSASPTRPDQPGSESEAEAEASMGYGDDDGLKEDIESGLEEAGARMRCLAFMDDAMGARLSSRLDAIGCLDESSAIEEITAFGKSMSEAADQSGGAATSRQQQFPSTSGANFTTDFGSVQRLPPPWWRTFPAFRRQHRQRAEAAASPAWDANAADQNDAG